MITVLASTDANAEFSTGWSGPHLHSVTGISGSNTVTLQFQAPDGTWINVDTDGETAVTWESSGQGASYLIAGQRYRYLAGSAGPTVQIGILDSETSAGTPVDSGPLGITVY